MDPVDPSAQLTLDQEHLGRFPEGYRHLAYLQEKCGFLVRNRQLPGLTGQAVERLYAQGKAWLGGASTAGDPIMP